jgi:hypothetical protein
MSQVFLELIHLLNGAVLTLTLVLLVMFWMLYKMGGLMATFKHVDNKHDKLDSHLDGIRTDLSQIKGTVNILYESHLKTVQKNSPLSLTQIGKDVSLEIGADAKISSHWDKIKSELQKTKMDNPYDIQVATMEFSQRCFDTIFTPEEQTAIKVIAFNKGMNLLEIYPILGVIIRDRILKEKGCSADQIDKHDPSLKLQTDDKK